MSTFRFGESKLYCNYMFSKELLDKANEEGLRLFRQISNDHIDENLVQFVCENVIYGWDNVYSVDGIKLEFDIDYLFMVFEQNPALFIDVLRHCSKLDNFTMVA